MSNYRLDVASATVAEAVRYAGGLMFDRVRAGWRVVVDLHADLMFGSQIRVIESEDRSPSPNLVGG
ncbi:hypothetical protein H7J88_21410 [Mycolicibacterium flavescens]|uniref:Uncharacterized protein n=1 Tax=Mycolicibacterium flavescens TaxID=1776 RepID=A0A1E3RI84_MYCFV|nr:hypothetical protein [Mycolicibacterium flavescens]MCV7282193.1 hypothetical protein [Mycolicibacterium flavescens]ODQ89549.1 hypothetical protein BHQ18_14120 [Mycolicibacterium flavescens]